MSEKGDTLHRVRQRLPRDLVLAFRLKCGGLTEGIWELTGQALDRYLTKQEEKLTVPAAVAWDDEALILFEARIPGTVYRRLDRFCRKQRRPAHVVLYYALRAQLPSGRNGPRKHAPKGTLLQFPGPGGKRPPKRKRNLRPRKKR